MELKNNRKIFFFFLSLIILSFYGTLGINSGILNTFPYEPGTDVLKIINFFRFITPLILSVFFISISAFFFKKNFFFLSLFVFFLLMVTPFLYNERIINYDEINLIILTLGYLSLFYLISYFDKDNLLIPKILILIILFTALTGLIPIAYKINEINFFNQNYYYLSNVQDNIFSHYFPRSTGISRSLSIFSIFLVFAYLYYPVRNYKKKLIFILILFLNIFIWKMQSRGALLCYIATFFLLNYLLNNLTFKKITKVTLIFLVLPFLISEKVLTPDNGDLFKKFQGELIKKNKAQDKKLSELDKYLLEGHIRDYNNKKKIRVIEKFPIIQDNEGSGRTQLWKISLGFLYQDRNFFGYGFQADRFLLSKTKRKWGDNVSNGLIYSLISGGVISLGILITYIMLFCKKIFELFLLKKNREMYKLRDYEIISILLIFFFLIRVLFENSFVVFGVDFLIMLPSAIIFCKITKKVSK